LRINPKFSNFKSQELRRGSSDLAQMWNVGALSADGVRGLKYILY